MRKKIIIKVFTAFSGYDSQCMALERLQEMYPHLKYELVGWSEIDGPAIKSHNAVFPEAADLNYGDISKIEWSQVPDFDVIIYSSCCQSLTRTGSQKGMTEGSGTPSSLIWYIREAIRIKKPMICLLENVPPLLETKFEGMFEKWTNAIANLGYRNTWSTLCAVDYGVPQNRNRAFLVSVRNDIKKNIYFPSPIGCKVQTEALLEESVDEKYYLSEGDAAAFVRRISDKVATNLSLPRIHKNSKCVKKIITPSCQGYNVHVCPTLVADENYGKCSYKRFLSTSHYPRPGVLEVWHTDEPVVIPYKDKIEHASVDMERKFKIINAGKDEILAQIKNMGPGDYLRLRRLTPRECFRFMSVEEDDINKLLNSGVREGQLYKMAGNAIVTKVLSNLYMSIFSDVEKWWLR